MSTAASLDDIRKRLGDRYDIERELGRGGMGTVYLARDLRLDRAVALKVLPPEFAADPSLRERFLRETRTAASFSHPNIVPVHAVEERDGLIAFAMGFVEGESIADRVRRMGPLDVRALVRLLQDIGYALSYAHGRGVVHRDIKPDNIMIERATGRALLMDFGISRTIATPVENKGLTRVGEVVGTPEYMSPEQASGDVVDGRSDLYSLGLVALFTLTGTPAITADTTQKILVKQLTETPPPAATMRHDLPAPLADAIDRCVAKTPDDRFASAEALVEAIDDARLAAPEIPLPIRLLTQEVATLGLVLGFLLIMSPFIANSMSAGGDLDAIIPMSVLFAVGFTRVLQASAAARRLGALGFTREDIMKGFRGVVDERESQRMFLRADADTRQRRQKTLIIAGINIVIAMLLTMVAWQQRVERDTGNYSVGYAGISMMVTAAILVGVSLVLVLRSPFRAPAGERLFRFVWLGWIGQMFLAFSLRNSRRDARTVETPRVKPVPRRETSERKSGPASQARTIEERVAALEKWREEARR